MVRERRRPLRVHDVHAFREHGHARAVRFRLLRGAPGGEKVGREGLGEPRARRGWDEQVRRRILRRRGPVPGRERQDLPVHDARAREGAGQRLGVALVRQRGRAVLVRHRRAVREHRSARTVRPRKRLLRDASGGDQVVSARRRARVHRVFRAGLRRGRRRRSRPLPGRRQDLPVPGGAPARAGRGGAGGRGCGDHAPRLVVVRRGRRAVLVRRARAVRQHRR
mmetsp:Transcript_3804/g.16124  ORF Transcript_3804/g.16124 Transcript_3804/m.16124 type:complete len:223 (-) Transcript_3804:526-1194(-)